MYLGPNVMDVFKILGMQDIVMDCGYECKNLAFENKLGIPIAQVDTAHDEQKYGSHGWLSNVNHCTNFYVMNWYLVKSMLSGIKK